MLAYCSYISVLCSLLSCASHDAVQCVCCSLTLRSGNWTVVHRFFSTRWARSFQSVWDLKVLSTPAVTSMTNTVCIYRHNLSSDSSYSDKSDKVIFLWCEPDSGAVAEWPDDRQTKIWRWTEMFLYVLLLVVNRNFFSGFLSEDVCCMLMSMLVKRWRRQL